MANNRVQMFRHLHAIRAGRCRLSFAIPCRLLRSIGNDLQRCMNGHDTSVPQAPLIEAVNTLPVITAWADALWMRDPAGMTKKFVKGMGARNELKVVQKGAARAYPHFLL
jgi:hypothetical protein